MESYKQEFIDFMVESHVLKFGEFTLKSGRKSPFFMNAGAYVTGSQLKRLGEYYAKAIHDKYGDDFDVLFGPAYKDVYKRQRQLYIHRNTLVYRLDKLQKSTGLDLRVFEDAITFKIALMVVKYMKYMETLEY